MNSFSKISLHIKTSRIQGLVDFVLAISGEPHRAPGTSEIFRAHKLDTPKNQMELKKLNQIKSTLFSRINFNGPISESSSGSDILSLILTQSMFARNLDDLKQRTMGLLPVRDQQTFFNVLQHFENLYNQLIWNPSLNELTQFKLELEKTLATPTLNLMFENAEIFYQSFWPQNTPFTIGLYPIPYIEGISNSAQSHSLESAIEHGVIMSKQKAKTQESIAVIFHELCHALYKTQTTTAAINLKNLFGTHPSPYRWVAYQGLDEALATSLGNGWAAQKLLKLSHPTDDKAFALGFGTTQSWYNDVIIDKYAKAIFPIVTQALDQRKMMDATFANQLITIYGSTFPESIYNYDHLMSQVITLTDGKKIQIRPREILRKLFPLNLYSGISPIHHNNSFDEMKKKPTATVLIAYSEAEFSQVKQLAKKVTAISQRLTILEKMKSKQIFQFVDTLEAALRHYIFIRADTDDELVLGLKFLSRTKRFNPQKPLMDFD